MRIRSFALGYRLRTFWSPFDRLQKSNPSKKSLAIVLPGLKTPSGSRLLMVLFAPRPERSDVMTRSTSAFLPIFFPLRRGPKTVSLMTGKGKSRVRSESGLPRNYLVGVRISTRLPQSSFPWHRRAVRRRRRPRHKAGGGPDAWLRPVPGIVA